MNERPDLTLIINTALPTPPAPLVVTSYIGFYFTGNKEWVTTCPCGVVARFPFNGMPTEDTPHPCGNLSHFSVRFVSEHVLLDMDKISEGGGV